LATWNERKDRNLIRLWHLPDAVPLHTLDLGYSVTSAAFSPDDATFAVGLDRPALQLRRVSDGSFLQQLELQETPAGITFSPDGQIVIVWSSSSYYGAVAIVNLWQVSDGTLLKTIEVANVGNIVFSPDGTFLAIGLNDGTVQLWGLQP
jgi:WD40 repeat protein